MDPRRELDRILRAENVDAFLQMMTNKLFASARRRGLPENEADDVVQDTVSTTLDKLARVAPGAENLERFMWGVFKFKILEAFEEARRRRAMVRIPQGETDDDGRRFPEIAARFDVLNEVSYRELMEALPPDLARLAELAVEECSWKEIMDITGWTERQLRTRMHRLQDFLDRWKRHPE